MTDKSLRQQVEELIKRVEEREREQKEEDDQIFREALGSKRKEVNIDFEVVHMGRMKLSSPEKKEKTVDKDSKSK